MRPDRSMMLLRSAKLGRAACAAILLTLFTPLAASRSASADWLVYRDGTRLETVGGWQIKGKLVVFSLPSGTLSAIRVDELDLDASREVTRSLAATREGRKAGMASEQPVTETAKPKRKARFVITDADVGHVAPDQLESSSDGEPEPVAQKGGLVVTRWGRSEPDADGILIVGDLRNDSDHASTAVAITVRALGQNDETLLEQPASLDATTLMPGQSTRFEARLRSVFSFRDLKFETSSIDLEVDG